MKTYTINWSRNDYGRLEIQAENEQEAIDKFYSGDFKDEELIIKGGNMEMESIEK